MPKKKELSAQIIEPPMTLPLRRIEMQDESQELQLKSESFRPSGYFYPVLVCHGSVLPDSVLTVS